MTGRDNVPANACPDNLPLKSGASTAGGDVPTFLDDLHGADLRRDTFKLPGAGASTVYVSALMNSMPPLAAEIKWQVAEFCAIHP